ncbi:MAG: VTT domain-containing protein [Leadbetterella sp.]|nr:VTT domain-containing protein [Leadbetterella sp.]
MAGIRKYAGVGSFVVFTLLPLLSSSFLTYLLYQHQDSLGALSAGQWVLFSLVLAVLCGVALIPPTFLAIVMGYFLDWTALPLLILINMLAIVLIYGLSRWVNLSWIENRLRKDAKRSAVLDRIRKEELKIIFFTKLSPLFPFAVTNLIFAASGAAFRNIIVGGFLGMIPRTVLAVYAGTQARGLRELTENPEGAPLSQWIISGLVLVSVAGLFFVLKKAFK